MPINPQKNWFWFAGVDPSVAWPTKKDIELQHEYEQVLYDGQSLPELIQAEQKRALEEEEEIMRKEAEIEANLDKTDEEMKAWQRRVESRNVYAEKERQKREQILAEVTLVFVIQIFQKALDFCTEQFCRFSKI